MEKFHSTTIIAIKKGEDVAIAGDGQVTFGDTIFKTTAKKIRKMCKGTILAGFAGSAADAFSLFDKFESKLEENDSNLKKASVELAKEWRQDKALRILEAMLIVADKKDIFILSGNGDVIEPEDGIATIGSGGNYAYSAAKALLNHTDMSAKDIARSAMEIAGSVCIYTNTNITLDTLDKPDKKSEEK